MSGKILKTIDKTYETANIENVFPYNSVQTSGDSAQNVTIQETLSPEICGSIALAAAAFGQELEQALALAFAVLLFRYTSFDNLVFWCARHANAHQGRGANRDPALSLQRVSFQLSENASFKDLLRSARTGDAFDGAEDDLTGLAPSGSLQFTFNESSDLSDLVPEHGLDFQVHAPKTGPRTIQIATKALDRETAGRMLGHYLSILRCLAKSQATSIRELDLLPTEEYETLVKCFNKLRHSVSTSQPVHLRFERKAMDFPEAVAVVLGTRAWTYGELNAKANQLAHTLLASGIEAEDFVGILLDRSFEMIVAVLGVLKAGAAYVPIDPTVPKDRIQHMIADSGLRRLVTRRGLSIPLLSTGTIVVTRIDDLQASVANPPAVDKLDSLAYLIYTSGSTGKPKGTMVEHRGLQNLIADTCTRYGIDAESRMLQFASFSFDMAAEEIFAPLISGAALVLRHDLWPLENPALFEAFELYGISHTILSSSYWQRLAIDAMDHHLPLPSKLKSIVIGGSAVQPEILARWLQHYGRTVTLTNAYGPTETTIAVTAHTFAKEWRVEGPAPIGMPRRGVSVYIVDAMGCILPIGFPGEIVIGGIQVGRGYWEKPELTREKFKPNFYDKNLGGRIYHTGDSGRWLPDGNLQYLGRIDTQVKIRGYRIEPGEIETELLKLPYVRQSLVIAHTDGDSETRLIAYLVVSKDARLNPLAIDDSLKAFLPAYMIPSTYIELENFPLNANGKIDIKALPQPARLHRSSSGQDLSETTMVRAVLDLIGTLPGLPRPSRLDNFFDIGGHSLLGLQLISRIRSHFGVALSLAEVFKFRTLGDLAEAVSIGLQASAVDAIPLVRGPDATLAPASYAQERLWFVDRLEIETGNFKPETYLLPSAIKLSGTLDRDRLQAALATVIGRHEILRTGFYEHEGQIHQRIETFNPQQIAFEAIGTEALSERIHRFAAEGFRWTQPSLVRFLLLKTAGDQHFLLMNMHHAIGDGWSVAVFMKEISKYYAHNEAAGELPIQYRDFAAWQRSPAQLLAQQQQLPYWKHTLAGLPTLLDLPLDYARPPVQSFDGAHHDFVLSAAMSSALTAFCDRTSTTIFNVLGAAYAILLARYSRQTDIAIGIPIAGRSRPELEPLIGFFVNNLVLRSSIDERSSFIDFLTAFQHQAVAAIDYQDAPFDAVVSAMNPERSLAYSPLFQAFFAFDSLTRQDFRVEGLHFEFIPVRNAVAKFDLSLTMQWADDALIGFFEYKTQLFAPSTIERMQGHYINLLQSIIEQPKARLSDLTMIGREETLRICAGFNRATAPHATGLIHRTIETHADTHGASTAIRFEGRALNYWDLNSEANRLARRLQTIGVGRDDRIAVCLDRSPDLIIALLAVWKAGAAYVPLDPTYPADRIQAILDDSRPNILITHRFYASLAEALDIHQVFVEDKALWQNEDDRNLDDGPAPADLAYLIYTSGSTGRPKGVMIEHRNLSAKFAVARQDFQIGRDECILAHTTISFDIAGLEVLFPLYAGATIVLASSETAKDGFKLKELIDSERPSFIQATPSGFHALLLAGWRGDPRSQLLCGGEAVKPELAERLIGMCRRFWNVYGPTETTIWSTRNAFEGGLPPQGRSLSIGVPFENNSVYILDNQHRLAPIGIAGELAIGGLQVGRGYFGLEELTADRFIDDPFTSRPGARLYRSGDLARWLHDGTLEYIGRLDFQVKVRGFRIELEEIESQILKFEGVRETVVIARSDDEEARIVAYVVPKSMASFDLKGLTNELRNFLPDFMMPSAMLLLEKLPLMPNGKIDRKNLPRPVYEDPSVQRVEPTTREEMFLLDLIAQLLGRPLAGLKHNFFDLGGHSLLAMQLVGRIRSEYQIDFPLAEVFARPILGDMAAAIALRSSESKHTQLPFADRNRDSAASYAQQRLWFLDSLDHGQGQSYLLNQVIRFDGPFELTALETALRILTVRHESLRTRFRAQDGQIMQVIDTEPSFDLRHHDLVDLGKAEQKAVIQSILSQKISLDAARLWHLSQLRTSSGQNLLCIVFHHIIADAWSLEIFATELLAAYEAALADIQADLPPLSYQYRDYSDWQRSLQHKTVLAKQLDYWRNELSGLPPLLALPLDRSRPAIASHRGARAHFDLGVDLSRQVREFNETKGVTSFMNFASVYALLLAHYSGQEDVFFGVPVANRMREEFETVIGFFVNTLIIRIGVTGSLSFNELLENIRRKSILAIANQDLPFDQIVAELKPERSLSYSPLFHVMFSFENDSRTEFPLPHGTASLDAYDQDTTKFDLTLILRDSDGVFSGSFEYNTDLYDRSTIDRMIRHYSNLVRAVVADSSRRLSDLPYLETAEIHQLLHVFNSIDLHTSVPKCVHELFEEQVLRTPDAAALIHESQSLSYGELNKKANQVAHALLERGVGPDTLVGICVERGLEMIIGLLGILKAGGAYVPIDMNYPTERIEFMLKDAGIALVLTQKDKLPILSAIPVEPLLLDSRSDLWQRYPSHNLNSKIAGHQLAYIIYTSGSTGKAKGVMIEHASLATYILTIMNEHGLGSDDRVLQFNSFSFDQSGEEIHSALCAGAALVIRSVNDSLVPEDILALMNRQRITKTFLPTSYWHQFIAQLIDLKKPLPTTLRVLVIGGSGAQAKSLQKWFEGFASRPKLVNGYGPTETTIAVTAHTFTEWGIDRGLVPIGAPLPHTTMHILDSALNLLPLGVEGELFLGGCQVGRGYWNRPDLSCERFIKDPFSNIPGARLYRTGDRARWHANGLVEYMGRIDSQVKIRGFRIEFAEIEEQILRLGVIRQAHVLAHASDGEEPRLVAYVEPLDLAAFELQILRDWLRQALPDFMMPSAFIAVARMPLNANGKIDEKALPKPQFTADRSHLVLPVTPTETVLVQIVGNLLNTDRVSVTANFFESGGHSLLAMQLVARIRSTFSVPLTLKDVFTFPILRELAAHLAEQRHAYDPEGIRIVHADRRQALPLSFAQERLWFIEQLDFESQGQPSRNYLIPKVFRFKGDLRKDSLPAVFIKLTERHEILRTALVREEGQLRQRISPESVIHFSFTDLSEGAATADSQFRALLTAACSTGFDLSTTGLARYHLVQFAHQSFALIIVFHHAVTDAWSDAIFERDFSAAYRAVHGAGTSWEGLPQLLYQYSDFAHWQRSLAQSARHDAQIAFWKHQLDGIPALLNLPTDFDRPAHQTFDGSQYHFELPQKLVEMIKQCQPTQGLSAFMILGSLFSCLLARYSDQTEICIGVPVANRGENAFDDLIGIFVNTVVLRNRYNPQASFEQFAQHFRTISLLSFDNADVPFDRLVRELNPERNLSHSPLFQVTFSFENERPCALDIPDVVAEVWPVEESVAKFDLGLHIIAKNDGTFQGILEYNRNLYSAATVAAMADHYCTFANAALQHPTRPLAQLSLIDDSGRTKLIQGNNATARSFVDMRPVHLRIEAQAKATPLAIAVSDGSNSLSYSELNERANSLAHLLREGGVGDEDRVAIVHDRSPYLIVAVLAVLKAGAAYVPIETNNPKERIRYILEDAGVRHALTQEKFRGLFEDLGTELVFVDAPHEPGFSSEAAPAIAIRLNQLAYVIYTSGTTGRPKGVMIEHGALANFTRDHLDRFPVSAVDKVLQFVSIGFDVAAVDIYPALMTGAELVMRTDECSLIPEEFRSFLIANGITKSLFPTPFWQTLLPAFEAEFPPQLRFLIIGGAALTRSTLKQWLAFAPSTCVVVNAYGPTETAIIVSYWPISAFGRNGQNAISIGGPIANTSFYVLDRNGQIVPEGIAGELHVGGVQLARGYLNRSELTREKFFDSREFSASGLRLYRTGDLCRWLPDGTIDYLGRIDNQVKIRGFRIELGEVAAQLMELPKVAEAHVIVWTAGENDKRLVAYIVPKPGALIEMAEIKRDLAKFLPNHMIPAHFVEIERLPLTVNQKVDEKALPQPAIQEEAYLAPRQDWEIELAAIFAKALKLPRIGLRDNFFQLGADSILLLQIVSEARRQGFHFNLKQVFELQTFESLIKVVKVIKLASLVQDDKVEGPLPLSAIQRSYLELRPAAPDHFNQSMTLEASLCLDEELLQAVLDAILSHHDGLRLRILDCGNARAAEILRFHSGSWPLEIMLGDSKPESAGFKDFSGRAIGLETKLSLSEGRLVQALLLLDKAAGKSILHLAVHHFVIDTVSWRILFEDITSAYDQKNRGLAEISLPPKTHSFRTWMEGLAAYALTSPAQADLQYWREIVKTPHHLGHIGQKIRKIPRVGAMRRVHGRLNVTETRALLQTAPRAYDTRIDELLLAALALTLKGWLNIESILINMEGHGRESVIEHLDISRTVGWFTSSYPLALNLKPNDIAGMIKACQETLRAVPERGIGYGLLRHLNRTTSIDLEASPQIGFNYLGQFSSIGEEAAPLLRPLWGFETQSVAAENPMPFVIDLNSLIADDSFALAWQYDSETFELPAMTALCESFFSQLRSIIDHCVTIGVGRRAGLAQGIDVTAAEMDQIYLGLPQGHTITSLFPLSPMQQGMIFHTLLQPGEGQYMEQFSCDLDPTIDRDAFQKAWEAIIQRHEPLRTLLKFRSTSDPFQIAVDRWDTTWTMLQLPESTGQHGEDAAGLASFKSAQRLLDFDFEKEPRSRLAIVSMPSGRRVFVWTYHHSILDGWSMPIIIRELHHNYECFRDGRALNLPLPVPFSTYLAWLSEQNADHAAAYWHEVFKGINDATRIAPASKSDTAGKPDYAIDRRSLGDRLTGEIREFARSQGLTLNTVVQGILGILLGRYTQKRDLVFGVTVSGRNIPLPRVERIVGNFINTLPLRITIPTQVPLGNWLRELQLRMVAHNDHAFLPLADIQAQTRIQTKGGLFDTLLVFENYPSEGMESAQNPFLKSVSIVEQTNYPLTIAVSDEDHLDFQILYDTGAFSGAWIAAFMNHLETLLQAAVEHPQGDLNVLPLLRDAELKKVMSLSGTRKAFPGPEAVHQLFEARVDQIPDAVAVSLGDQRLRYAELNDKANRLARILLASGVRANEDGLVAILVERSLWMIVSAFAVWKAGAAYLPIDPELPAERIRYMLEDARVKHVITQSSLIEKIAACEVSIMDLDGFEVAARNIEAGNLGIEARQSALAYVVYTSGSSGMPKGVMIEHGSLRNFVLDHCERFLMQTGDRIMQFISFGFDYAGVEIYPTLVAGAEIAMIKLKDIAASEIISFLKEYGITKALFPTSLWQGILHDLLEDFPPTLKLIGIGGSAVSSGALSIWRQRAPSHCHLENGYGPTEGTIAVTYEPIQRVEVGIDLPVAIGKPLLNAKVYIVDDHGLPVPIGIPGEIHIGGIPVARGYLYRPELTKEKFIADSFSSIANARRYKTGDLGRWLPNGSIEYLGRIDQQVKIRGYRIELGEIESQLVTLPMIKEAFVLAHAEPGEEPYLMGYLVLQANEDWKPETLRSILKQFLPDYMIPAHFVALPSLPRTLNGKVDTKQLPKADEITRATLGSEAAINGLELQVLTAMEQILNRQGLHAHSRFFDEGGNSMLAIKLLTYLNRELKAELKMSQIFEAATPQGIGRLIADAVRMNTDSEVLKVRPEGQGSPIILLPPLFHDISMFRDLLQALPKSTPIYGIEVMHHKIVDAGSIDAIASHYLERILALNLPGGYKILGYSASGILAQELGRRLALSGQNVTAVISLDANTSYADTGFVYGLPGVIGNFVLPLDLTVVELIPFAEQIAYCESELRRLEVELIYPLPELIRRCDAISDYLKVHKAKPSTVRHLQINSSLEPRPDVNWQSLCEGQLISRTIAAGHYEIISKQHAPQVAAYIADLTDPQNEIVTDSK